MGHRAIVAYERSDGRYDVRYSHWGAADLALADALTADAPLAGGSVDAALFAESIPIDRVLAEYLDPCVYEALYLVSPDFAVTAHRVLWLAWGADGERIRGAILAVEPGARDRGLRAWFRATKTTLADVMEMGVLSRGAAEAYLEARVCEERGGRAYTYGEGEVDWSPSGSDRPR